MEVSAVSSALNGLDQAESRLNTVAMQIAAGPEPSDPADTVTLSDQVVSLLTSRRQAQTDVSVLKTADEMARSTLSLLG